MRITYNEGADAVYIHVSNRKILKTISANKGNINIDYDLFGNIVGIEILDTIEPHIEKLNEND